MLEACSTCQHSSCLPLRLGWMCWKRTEGHTERLPMDKLKVDPNHWCEAYDPDKRKQRENVQVDPDRLEELRAADRENWVERPPVIENEI